MNTDSRVVCMRLQAPTRLFYCSLYIIYMYVRKKMLVSRLCTLQHSEYIYNIDQYNTPNQRIVLGVIS